MRVLEDRHLRQLFLGEADQPVEGRVALQGPTLPVGQHHPDRGVVEDGPHSRLALRRGALGGDSFADVAHDDLDRGAAVEDDRPGRRLHVEDGPVAAQMPLARRLDGAALADDLGNPIANGVFVRRGHEIPDAEPNHFGRITSAVQTGGSAIDEHDPPILVDRHGLREQVEKGLIASLGLRERECRSFAASRLRPDRYDECDCFGGNELRIPGDAGSAAIFANPLRQERDPAFLTRNQAIEGRLCLDAEPGPQPHEIHERRAGYFGERKSRAFLAVPVPQQQRAVRARQDDERVYGIDDRPQSGDVPRREARGSVLDAGRPGGRGRPCRGR